MGGVYEDLECDMNEGRGKTRWRNTNDFIINYYDLRLCTHVGMARSEH